MKNTSIGIVLIRSLGLAAELDRLGMPVSTNGNTKEAVVSHIA